MSLLVFWAPVAFDCIFTTELWGMKCRCRQRVETSEKWLFEDDLIALLFGNLGNFAREFSNLGNENLFQLQGDIFDGKWEAIFGCRNSSTRFKHQTKLWKREYGNCFRINASLLLGMDESSSLTLGKLSAPNNRAYTLQNYYEDANRRSTTEERMKKKRIYNWVKSSRMQQRIKYKKEEEYLQTNGIVFGSAQGIAKGTPTAAAIYVFVFMLCVYRYVAVLPWKKKTSENAPLASEARTVFCAVIFPFHICDIFFVSSELYDVARHERSETKTNFR